MIYTYQNFPYIYINETECQKRRKGNQGRRDNHKKYKDLTCAFDIETTNDDESQQAFMYIWQCQIDDYTIIGRTWDDFLRFLARIIAELKENEYIIFWVHNLSFEFQWLRGIYDFTSDEVFAVDSRKVLRCEMFDHLEFRCSYLQTNMSLAEFTNKMGVANKKLSGEEFNYSKARYPWTELSEQEIQYCINDVKGLVQAMQKQCQMDGDNWYSIPYTATGYPRRDLKAAMRHYNWEKLKDQLPDYEQFCMLRSAFRGGDTHCNRYYSGLLVHDVKSYDRASSYPDVQVNCEFPMGPWIRETNVDLEWVLRRIYRHKRAVLMTVALFDVALQDPMWGSPYLAKAKCQNVIGAEIDNGRILCADYLETTITDIDLKIIMEEYTFSHFDVKVCYHARYGKLPLPFRRVVLDYFHRKTALKGVEGQEIYYSKEKAKLNALYGCTVMSPCRPSYLFEDDFIIKDEDEREMLDHANRHAFLNYAWGCWTTAHARYELFRAVKLIHDTPGADFIYCDTDSVKYVGDVDFTRLNDSLKRRSIQNGAMAIDAKGKKHYLGVWEDDTKDGSYRSFRSWGAKKYAYEDTDKTLHVTVAGVNKKNGAAELSAKGGITAFHPGLVFRTAGGQESIYNDHPPMDHIIREGKPVQIISNVYLHDSMYSLGITGDYMRILDRAKEWRMATENFY